MALNKEYIKKKLETALKYPWHGELSIGTMEQFREGLVDFSKWASGVINGPVPWITDRLATIISDLDVKSLDIDPARNYYWQRSDLEGFCYRIKALLPNDTLAGYYLGRIGNNSYAAFGYTIMKDETAPNSVSTNSCAPIASIPANESAEKEPSDKAGQPIPGTTSVGEDVASETFVVEGVDINRSFVDGSTRLHIAAREGQKDVVELIISKGVNVNLTDGEGRTPLELAVAKGHTQIAELLISKGADPNTKTRPDGAPLLRMAVWNKDKEMVNVLISKGADVNARDRRGETPLHWAVSPPLGGCQKEIVEILILNEAQVNARNQSGWTALSAAARRRDVEAMRLFLAAGALVNVSDGQCRYPLDHAVSFGHKEVVQTLVSWGFYVTSEVLKGPLEKAESEGYIEIAMILRNAIAQRAEHERQKAGKSSPKHPKRTEQRLQELIDRELAAIASALQGHSVITGDPPLIDQITLRVSLALESIGTKTEILAVITELEKEISHPCLPCLSEIIHSLLGDDQIPNYALKAAIVMDKFERLLNRIPRVEPNDPNHASSDYSHLLDGMTVAYLAYAAFVKRHWRTDVHSMLRRWLPPNLCQLFFDGNKEFINAFCNEMRNRAKTQYRTPHGKLQPQYMDLEEYICKCDPIRIGGPLPFDQ